MIYLFAGMKRTPTVYKRSFQAGRIGLGWLISIGVFSLIIFTLILPNGEPEQTDIAVAKPFDERLLSCNELKNAEPTEAFDVCLQAAKEGKYEAQSKIAWAYSQTGDFQNLEEAYKWVTRVSYYDRGAELIRYILLRLFGDNPADKEFGEEGIKRLANLNYPPAAAYLGILYKLDENVLDKTSNSMWLLERAHEKDPEVFNAYQLAIIYANGFGVEQNYNKARDVLLEYAEHSFPTTTNNVAWFLATLEENPLSSPEIAVSLAERVTNESPYGENHVYVDTLAATYAARGNYELAIEHQSDALSRLQQTAEAESENDYSRLITEYQDRLALYKDNKKAVTETLQREYESFFKGVKVFVERRLISSLNVYIEKPQAESVQN